jgi:hypothetical protein
MGIYHMLVGYKSLRYLSYPALYVYPQISRWPSKEI